MNMTKNKVLSPFPYYGGKARMSPLICSLIDYENTVVYVEPYGGGCRTLLNKKPHEEEIYNDFSFGLTSFFNIMSDRDKTERLIGLLLENPPDREQFRELVIRRMGFEDRLNTSSNAIVASMALDNYRKCRIKVFTELRKAIRQEDYKGIVESLKIILTTGSIVAELDALEELQYRHYLDLYTQFWTLISDEYDREGIEADFDRAWEQDAKMPVPVQPERSKKSYYYDFYAKAKKAYVDMRIMDAVHSFTDDTLSTNELGESVSDLEVAFVIFQLYYSSRDGMGVAWSEEKNRDIRAYTRAVLNLRNISERMAGVVVTQCDALYLVRNYRKYRDAMIYLDPSYLKPEDEKKNLGEVYKMSYGYKDHERLLQEITKPDTRAKILISNYDVDLYNEYLSDWKKTYFRTFTGVGGKKGNQRIEVLWQNY